MKDNNPSTPFGLQEDVDPNAELRSKLAELRAAKAVREAKKAKDEEASELSLEIETEEAIAKAEADHGAVGRFLHVLQTQEGVVIVKRPPPVVFKRYCDSKHQNAEDRQNLVQACLVYPDRAKFEVITTALSGVVPTLVIAINRLAGFRNEDLTGK